MTHITGYEPRLSPHARKGGYRQLAPRRLATLLNVLAPDAISLDAAAAMLHSDQFFMRYNAARLLSERGDRDARLVLQAALEQGDGPTRASVARHLHRFSWYAAEPMIRQALADSDERVREGAVYALCDLRELNAYQLLVETLEGATDTERAAAVWGLRNCQDSAAVPVLAMALRAGDPDVRSKAVEALSANDTPEAWPVVRGALDDPHSDVVYNATLSLIELRGERALAELAPVIQHTQGARLEPVLRGFFHATNYLHVELADHPAADSLLAALEHAITDAAPEARMGAAWILAWMRHTRAAALLENAYYAETVGEVKAHLLRVAFALMSPVGPALLEDGLTSDDPAVRDAADFIWQTHSANAFAEYDETKSAARPLGRAELGI